MDKKIDEQNFQQKYMQYNLYKQQAQGLLKEISLLNQTMQNLTIAQEVLTNLNGAKKDSEILVPVGGNTFVKAKIADEKNVLSGVGADVILKKPIPEALKTITEQLENLKKTGEELGTKMKEIEDNMRDLEPEIQKMMMQAQKEHKH
jgi:prefoldin alpha subunit